MINASFVYGFDNDDPEVFGRTVDWAIANHIDTATFHILTPYPGTPLHAEMESQGRIVDLNYDHYDTAHVVFQPKLMTAEQLEAGYLWSYRKFYSWSSIRRRCFHKSQGLIPRLMMNVCYKKFEPFWEGLITCGHTSWVFDLFIKAVHAYGNVGSQIYIKAKANALANRP